MTCRFSSSRTPRAARVESRDHQDNDSTTCFDPGASPLEPSSDCVHTHVSVKHDGMGLQQFQPRVFNAKSMDEEKSIYEYVAERCELGGWPCASAGSGGNHKACHPILVRRLDGP
jgi:hypothetical protein